MNWLHGKPTPKKQIEKTAFWFLILQAIGYFHSCNMKSSAQAKAQAWAERLASDGYLHHSNLTDGIHVRWCSLGENVGMGPTVTAVEQAYMASSGHRANILATRWNGVGVGYAKRGNTVYTVQVFIKTC